VLTPIALDQALTYLAVEAMNVAPDAIRTTLKQLDDPAVVVRWLKRMLLIGCEFQMSLDRGVLDDL
jgi:hypothetical protein